MLKTRVIDAQNLSLPNYSTTLYYYLCSWGYLYLLRLNSGNTVKQGATAHVLPTLSSMTSHC